MIEPTYVHQVLWHHVPQWNQSALQHVLIQQVIWMYLKEVSSASPFEFLPAKSGNFIQETIMKEANFLYSSELKWQTKGFLKRNKRAYLWEVQIRIKA